MRYSSASVVASLLALGACTAVPPAGPDVLAVPPQGKTLAAFQGEDIECRSYAQSQAPYGPAASSASANSLGSTLAGTAIGAGAGAALGSVGGALGAGAAIGAVGGALVGSSIGADQASATTAGLQQQYDIAYTQCMASKGNTVQSPPGPGYAGLPYPPPYPYPYYGPPVVVGGPVFGYGYGGPYYHHYWHRW